MTGVVGRCKYSEIPRPVAWTEFIDVPEQCHGLHVQGQSVKKRLTLLEPIYPDEEGTKIVSLVCNCLGFEREYNDILNSYPKLCASYTLEYLKLIFRFVIGFEYQHCVAVT